MTVDFTQSELNELVYALGIAKMNGKMLRNDIAEQVSDKLFRALAVENVRIDEQTAADSIIHDMNFKRKYIQYGEY